MEARLQSLREWAEQSLARRVEISLISGDASFRKYYRLSDSTNTWVAMDAPPEKESVALFGKVAGILARANANVPQILDMNTEQGFALLADFGDQTYFMAAKAGDVQDLYDRALQSLARIQSLGAEADLPPYSRRLLSDELQLYADWYIKRNLDHEPTARERHTLAEAFDLIVERTASQPPVPVHRDYHSRNLMVTDPSPGILDFQDAVIGPYTYDLLSLLKDAYIRWPDEQVDGWIGRFLDLAGDNKAFAESSGEKFREDFDWVGVQRFLKVVGIFSRLFHRDGKSSYLNDLPLAEDYLVETIGRLPELAPLARIVKDNRERRLER